MSEKFIELFEQIDKSENELWRLLCKCIGKSYKFTNPEGEVFYITVDYFRGFDQIGITHVDENGTEESHYWDTEEFYEIIKDSVEIK